MKNAMFFSLIILVIGITSCTKENINPNGADTYLKTVQNRTTTTEIDVTVESAELNASNLIVEFSSDVDLTEVTPEADQTLSFTGTNTAPTFDLQVNSFQVTGANLEIEYNVTGLDLSGLELDGGQIIIIDDTDLD